MARSTVDAISRVVTIVKTAISGSRCAKLMCAIILDIRNAFNSVRWDKNILSLKELKVLLDLHRVVCNCLTDRILMYNTDLGMHKIIGGVPQGSVLEPLLWNVFTTNC